MAAILAICISLFIGYRVYDWIVQLRAEIAKSQKTQKPQKTENLSEESSFANMDFTKDKTTKKPRIPVG